MERVGRGKDLCSLSVQLHHTILGYLPIGWRICIEFPLTFLVNLQLKLQPNSPCLNPENGFTEVLLCLRLPHKKIIYYPEQ